MSLLDAFILDPAALDVWIAARTDGVLGSGTEDDPYDGGTHATPQVTITNINSSGTTATATTAANHGFQNLQLVLITGVLAPGGSYYPDGSYYNGVFAITYVNSTKFTFTMWGPYTGSVSGAGMSCQAAPYMFDTVMRALPSAHPVAVRLGPGTFQTQGYTPNVPTSWVPFSGMKVLGSGMEVSVLQLVAVAIGNQNGTTVISSNSNTYLDSCEAWDFTVDCNVSGQLSPQPTCGAILFYGKHARIRRIRAVNWGTQNPNVECFGVGMGAANPDQAGECFDNWDVDCIVEQPGLNNYRESSLLGMGAQESSDRLSKGFMVYHRACVVRNCFVDCEFRQNPVQISSISYSGTTGVFNVTTRRPHGHVTNDWIRITGAVLTNTNNSFNGSYEITRIDDYNFQYTPSPSQPSTAAPTGDMWVGKFPNYPVHIVAITGGGGGGPLYTYTVQTYSNHYLAPAQFVRINNVSNDGGRTDFDKVLQVLSVADPKTFQIQLDVNATAPGTELVLQEHIGVAYQALNLPGGTAAVVECNRVCNVGTGGPYHDTYNSRDLIVRNNYYRAVLLGAYENLADAQVSWNPIGLVSMTWAGGAVTVTTSYPHGLIFGDGVNIVGTSPPGYNGSFTVIAATTNTFEYALPTNPGTLSILGSCARIWQLDRLVVENNQFDLIPTPVDGSEPCGVRLAWGDPTNPFARFQQAVIRRNSVQQVDGVTDFSGDSKAAQIEVCGNLISEENVIDVFSLEPLWFTTCGNTQFFANQSPSGALIQGYSVDSSTYVGELSTNIDDAALLAF